MLLSRQNHFQVGCSMSNLANGLRLLYTLLMGKNTNGMNRPLGGVECYLVSFLCKELRYAS